MTSTPQRMLLYRAQLRATGTFPLWDSRFQLGRPMAGDPQPGLRPARPHT